MNEKKKLLVVSHDESMRVLISEILRYNENYEIMTAEDGAKGMIRAIREAPDLVILDIMMPKIDGYHVCKMLKSDVERDIPVIMLCYQDFNHKHQELPADEFLPAPFDPMGLISRVEAVLQKSRTHGITNPFIQLSGYMNIGRELLAKYKKFAIGYADLDNLATFNEQYGSTKGDQIIGHTKRIISDSVKTFGIQHDFVKHISGDDFIFVTVPEKIGPICRDIITTFDREVLAYYGHKRRAGENITHGTQDRTHPRFSAISISIAVVTNFQQNFTDFAELGEIAAEIRKYLKTLPGSNYYINRRSRR
jgi:CheY-like chemotaxis protein